MLKTGLLFLVIGFLAACEYHTDKEYLNFWDPGTGDLLQSILADYSPNTYLFGNYIFDENPQLMLLMPWYKTADQRG